MESAVKAPYASTAIPLFLSSVTGQRYRTMQCVECGSEIIERNNNTLFLINNPTRPSEIAIAGETIPTICGNCEQAYTISISLDVTIDRDSVALHLQPESVYIAVATIKTLRYIHCLECGKPFHSISDRVSQVVDNRIPIEHVNPARMGIQQALCHNSKCKQTWALMV